MCAQTNDELTPEGLRVLEVPFVDGSGRPMYKRQEIGFNGWVIFEETWEDAGCGLIEVIDDGTDYLINKVLELHKLAEQRRAERASKLELAALNRNRKLACKRFRRRFAEKRKGTEYAKVSLDDPGEREILRQALKAGAGQAAGDIWEKDPELGELMDTYDIWGIPERLTRAPSPMLVGKGIPNALVHLLGESRSAYGFGLFGLAVIVCRAVLEEAVGQVVRPEKEMKLSELIEAGYLSQKLRPRAHHIRERAYDLLHKPLASSAFENEAWHSLLDVGKILEELFGSTQG